MFKAVIFDINGIFVKGPKLTLRPEEDFHVPEAESLAALSTVMNAVRRPGAGDVFSYWKPYLEKWGIPMSREKFLDYWFRRSEIVEPEMFLFANELQREGVKVFGLSNNFKERTEYYEKNFPQLKTVFDKTYYSWRTGFLKNDPRSYKHLLEDSDLTAGECVFFDDSEENVRIARSVGMQAHVFSSLADVRAVFG